MYMNAINVDPTQPKPWYADIAEGIIGIINSQNIVNENKRRIAAGLPPLTDAQIKSLTPTANVNVALPPALQWGLLGGGAILLYLLATRK